MARIFVSYAREDGKTAEAITVALRQEGHQVFLDRQQLLAGHDYHKRIRDELAKVDLVIFLLSKHFFKTGSYALTELELTKSVFPDGRGVLPVAIGRTDLTAADPYLQALTWLIPKGSVAAEVAAATALRLAPPRSEPPSSNERRSQVFRFSQQVLRGIFLLAYGTAIGLIVSPFMLLAGGWVPLIAISMIFGLFSNAPSFAARTAFGMVSAALVWACGFSAYTAVGAVADDQPENEWRDMIVGICSGLLTGGLLLGTLIATKKVAPASALIAGAILGAGCGLWASWLDRE